MHEPLSHVALRAALHTAAPGADIHLAHLIPTRPHRHGDCTWCGDDPPRPATVTVTPDQESGSEDCCRRCVRAVYDHLLDQGCDPEGITVDAYLTEATA